MVRLGLLGTGWMLALGCGGLWPEPVEPPPPEIAPPVVVIVPAPEPEPSPARLEIFWGTPEQGDAVWAEGRRMTWDPELGPEGTWYLDVEPGRFELVIRDGIQRIKRPLETDVEVGPGEILWCHPLEYDEYDEEGYVLLEEDCRRGAWPGEISREPL